MKDITIFCAARVAIIPKELKDRIKAERAMRKRRRMERRFNTNLPQILRNR